MIVGAPFSFALVVLIMGAILYLMMRWQYKAIIAQKDEQLRTLRMANEQYRERLHLQPPAQSRYTRMTNAELQQEAFAMLKKLRQFSTTARRKFDEVFSIYGTIFVDKNKSGEEKEKVWMETNRKTANFFTWFTSEYDARFRADIAPLQGEIRSRLTDPKGYTELDISDFEYEYPTNLPGLEDVIAHLERLAKQLS